MRRTNKFFPSGFLCQLEVTTPDGQIVKTYNQSYLFSLRFRSEWYTRHLDDAIIKLYNLYKDQIFENLINQFYNDSLLIKSLDNKSNEFANILKFYPETKKLLSLNLKKRKNKAKQNECENDLVEYQKNYASTVGDNTGQTYNLMSSLSQNQLTSLAYNAAGQMETKQNAAEQIRLQNEILKTINELKTLKKEEEELMLSITYITGDNKAYQYLLTENVKYLEFVELNNERNIQIAQEKKQNSDIIYNGLNKTAKSIKSTSSYQLQNSTSASGNTGVTNILNKQQRDIVDMYNKQHPNAPMAYPTPITMADDNAGQNGQADVNGGQKGLCDPNGVEAKQCAQETQDIWHDSPVFRKFDKDGITDPKYRDGLKAEQSLFVLMLQRCSQCMTPRDIQAANKAIKDLQSEMDNMNGNNISDH